MILNILKVMFADNCSIYSPSLKHIKKILNFVIIVQKQPIKNLKEFADIT